MDAYATLIADGAAANIANAQSLTSTAQRHGYLVHLIDSIRPIAQGTESGADAAMETTPGATARPALHLGAALSEYVELRSWSTT